MPARISNPSLATGSSRSSRQKGNQKRKRRALDAYAIAENQNHTHTKIPQHRLGEVEREDSRRKKQRIHSDDGDTDQRYQLKSHRIPLKEDRKEQSEDLNVSSGSDSEGHQWRLGEVHEEDDSDVNSDEAFGESDGERFEGFIFRGSSRGEPKKSKTAEAKQRKTKEISLDEDEGSLSHGGEEDGMSEDAIDLATAIDQQEESEDGEYPGHSVSQHNAQHSDAAGNFQKFSSGNDVQNYSQIQDESPSEYDDQDEESTFSLSDVDDLKEDDQDQRRQLQNMVASLPKSQSDSNQAQSSLAENSSSASTLARALAALKQSSSLDPAFDREVKRLSNNLQISKGDKSSKLVRAPLPKRQQDRIDRKAAYGKAKQTLNRWIDTVKHNRRAEHLTFPLADPEAQEAQGTNNLLAANRGPAQNDLETTIQGILQESGLTLGEGTSEQSQTRDFEELQTNKMSLEEVLARRAELRKARDLLFREEVRAKRIKKIKSKAYRRIHRKDAQKAAQKEKDMLVAAGLYNSEDEKEENDRRRAEERVGGRHRESRWAKGMKQTGRTGWDEIARDDVAEMARKREELRTRMEGKKIPNEEDTNSGMSDESGDDEEDVKDGDDVASQRRLSKLLDRTQQEPEEVSSLSNLASMKFMRRADAKRKQQNDEDVAELRERFHNQESEDKSESEVDTKIGRRIFGPTERPTQPQLAHSSRSEFEEPELSDGEDGDTHPGSDTEVLLPQTDSSVALTSNLPVSATKISRPRHRLSPPAKAKPFANKYPPKSEQLVSNRDEKVPFVIEDAKKGTSASKIKGLAPSRYPPEADMGVSEENEMEGEAMPLLPSNLELVRSAFGDDDADDVFAREKADVVESEDEKVIDNALPGWGSWTGEGISKRELKRTQRRNKGRFLIKEDGVQPSNRKDKNLDRVIISEKGSKKNAKYLASALPHPFESRLQYERSIRHPVGPEWTTKETFQSTTKPRVLVKRGRLIAPMKTPVV